MSIHARILCALFSVLVFVPAAQAQTMQTLAVLQNGPAGNPAPEGAAPVASLIVQGKYLYGTTSVGGNIFPDPPWGCGFSNGCGSVFRVDPATGNLTIIYKFCSLANCADGGHPLAGLTYRNGAFYGTTETGGTTPNGIGGGTVFKLTPPAKKGGLWTETVLYSFCATSSCSDGNRPSSPVVFDSTGALYGTTAGSVPDGIAGTIYRLDPTTGSLSTLYAFSGGADGADPVGGVVFGKGGSLYGTTTYGGISTGTCGSSDSNGTVFRFDIASRQLTTIFAFPTGETAPCWIGGKNPVAGLLVDSAGNLYGTAAAGASGGGVVFKLAPNGKKPWKESVLYAFCAVGPNYCIDGAGPNGPLVQDQTGQLYGTTNSGGANSPYATGSVFDLDPVTGTLTTLTAFVGTFTGKCPNCFTLYSGGTQPAAGLALHYTSDSTFVLYGTRSAGGSPKGDSCYTDYNTGCGTVFALTP